MSTRFGEFIFDPVSGILERDGNIVPLQPQPARVLALLIERAGDVVTREELKRQIWVNTWVNFNEGLNFCIRQVRIALGESAKNPVYLQTLPHRGYRFIAPVDVVPDEPPLRRRALLTRKIMRDVAAAMF